MKLSDIREALTELQVTPSKTLGQNFLHDQNLARWIVAQLEAGPGEELVEIGPGLGALTGAALETGASCHRPGERTSGWRTFCGKRSPGNRVCAWSTMDALEFDPRSLWARQPVKVFGNLPYYISTPLLFHFTSPAVPVTCGRCFCCNGNWPSASRRRNRAGKDYGILSVVVGTALAGPAAENAARQRCSCRSRRWIPP